jgi:hypothetical protein
MVWVMDHSKARLGDRLVLLAIANHAREDGTNAWPSVAQIAREARVTPRSVQRSMRVLETLGELIVEPGAGFRGTNLCRVAMSGVQGTDETSGVTSTTEGGDARVTRTVLEPSLVGEAFARFWNIYPRRTGGPKQAKIEFAKALREGASVAEIIEGARRFADDPNLPKDRTKIPHATTWLHQGRWGDDPLPGNGEPPPRAGSGGSGGWDRDL